MNVTVTLFGQIVVFALLIWFVNRFLWAPLTLVMEQRKKRIADGLAAAERGRHEQALAEQRAAETLKESKEKAAGIIAQAQKRAGEIIAESQDTARVEGERLIAAANAEIEREVHRAREALRGKVVALAVAGAGKVLKREVDAGVHDALLQDLAGQL